MNKIAVFINSIDPVFLEKKHKKNLFVIVQKDTNCKIFAKNNFNKDQLIILNKADIKSAIKIEAFATILKKNNIKYLFIPHRTSEEIDKWCKKNNIKPLVTELRQQKRLENKLYFDKLLKKNKIPSPKTLKLNKKTSRQCVLQEASSFGMFGTKFCQNRRELTDAIKTYKFQKRNLILREYLDGMSIGVSIFMDKDKNYFFSGMRRQCFEYKNGFPHVFLGIQWIPHGSFPAKTIKEINKVLEKLTKTLIKEKFIGVANIDFILRNNKPHVIECNPRMSSATQHLFSVPNLCGSKNVWSFIINAFNGEKNPEIQNGELPRHSFRGCLLDIDAKGKVNIKNIPKVGVYTYKNKKIKFVSRSIRDMRGKNDNFLLFNELSGKKSSCRTTTLCTIISNKPLFDISTGKLNKDGKYIYNHFKKEIILLE